MLRKYFFLRIVAFSLAYPVLAAEPPAEPPPGTIKADVGFPAVGTKWVGRIVLQSGPTVTLTYTVIEDGVYEGKPVHRVVVGNDTNLYDVATSNAIATLRFGKEVTSTLPHDGMLSWPLYVEDVTVPAGTWKALKIQSETSNSAFSTIWYVPEIKLMVKRINETTVGHPSGRTKVVYEVIQYTAPQ